MHVLSLQTNSDGDLFISKLVANRSTPATVVEFLRRVQANVWYRKFFACQDLRQKDAWMFGLGSRNIQEGDWCCILLGCSVPVILREEEKSLFKFVGECYVHDMMDGQAMTIEKPATEFAIQ